LSAKYVADIARAESLVENQSGSDETRVENALRDAGLTSPERIASAS
jgi:hypothetical protein